MPSSKAPVPCVEILSQGDEIVGGHTVDTNAAELSRAVEALGLKVLRHVAVGDDPDAIAALLRESAARADEVVCTGGLGPTSDDWTAEAASRAFALPLEERQEALDSILAFFQRLGRPMNDTNRRQARLPEGARLLTNEIGTAPGFVLERPPCRLWFFPGVPREMRGMVERHLLPGLKERWPSLRPERLVTLRCIGTPESDLAAAVDGIAQPGLRVGYRAAAGEVQVKLRFDADFDPSARDTLVAEARARAGAACFGVDCGPVQEVLVRALLDRAQTVACAESCTAGRVAAAFTEIPGASDCFLEGAVVYANEAKIRTCGVEPALLARDGAVSESVARALADGIRRHAAATWGLATTGIAGPGGGSHEKPIGTVHIAVSGPLGVAHRALRLPGSRLDVMARATASVLDLLRREMERIS
jgi:nicotinamide-nucleotide amidase